LAVLALCLGAAPLAAQSGAAMRFQFVYESGDSVYAALAGGEAYVTLMAFDQAFSNPGLGAFMVRVYFDPTRATYVAGSAASACPDAATFPLNAPVQGPNYVEFSAAGCAPINTYAADVVRFKLRLEPGPASGTVLYADPVSVTQSDGTPRPSDEEAALAEICLGTTVWGDIDADATVGSRDALIALAGAVGLPTGGFDLTRGDVDSDGRVTSRDALFMLSSAVALPTSGSRTGEAIAEHCAPQTALPDPLYYQSEGSGRAVAGVNGLTIRPAADTLATIVGDSSADWFTSSAYNHRYRPRLSPDGSKLVYACWYNTSTSDAQICTTNADGSGGIVRLSNPNGSVHASPDWSPAGDSIIYVRDGQIFIMDAAGGGQSAIPGIPSFVNSVAWQPRAGSHTIAYTRQGCNGEVHTRDRDTGADVIVAAGDCGPKGQPDLVDWSPAGDSLAFDMFINNKKVVIVAPAVASAPLTKRVSSDFMTANEPLWRTDGMVFQFGGSLYGQLYFRRNDGSVFRLTRAAQDLHFPGTKKQ
jgi:hypothetical protein